MSAGRVLAACLVIGSARAWAQGEGIRDAGGPSLARAVAWAMLVHDRSVRSLEWEGTCTIPVDAHPPTVFTSKQAFDDLGRWRMELEARWGNPPEGAEAVSRFVYVCDGDRLVAWGWDETNLLVRPGEGEPGSHTGPDSWLGRWVDRQGVHRLGDICLASKDLTAARLEDGAVRLSCTSAFGRLGGLAEIEADPVHGYAPRRITIKDRLLGVPYYDMRVLAWTFEAGVWLPAEATLDLCQLGSMTPEQRAAFQAAREREGVDRGSDFYDADVQSRFAKVVNEVFGSAGYPYKPMSPTHHSTFRYKAVNGVIPADLFERRIGVGDTAFDGLIDCIKEKGTLDWVPQSPPDPPE